MLCIVIAFNLITGLLENIGDTDYFSDNEIVSVQEDINELYPVIDEATIEVDDTDGEFKNFTLKIRGMEFDDYLSENMQDDILSGKMAQKVISEDTFVEMIICSFSDKTVDEERYNDALNDSYFLTGEQVEGECKYEFYYDFDYDEIVHISGGVDFYLGDGMYINAELPFSAFSVSEDGEITYYTSYADSGTAWNTVFEECSNKQEVNGDVFMDFDAVVTVEGE